MPITLALILAITGVVAGQGTMPAEPAIRLAPVLGLTGRIRRLETAIAAPEQVEPLATADRPADIDLRNMAAWALNYLIRTPRKALNYQPVFQCHPLGCPPVPSGDDPVVACDTDARMDWEWFHLCRRPANSPSGPPSTVITT